MIRPCIQAMMQWRQIAQTWADPVFQSCVERAKALGKWGSGPLFHKSMGVNSNRKCIRSDKWALHRRTPLRKCDGSSVNNDFSQIVTSHPFACCMYLCCSTASLSKQSVIQPKGALLTTWYSRSRAAVTSRTEALAACTGSSGDKGSHSRLFFRWTSQK